MLMRIAIRINCSSKVLNIVFSGIQCFNDFFVIGRQKWSTNVSVPDKFSHASNELKSKQPISGDVVVPTTT